MSAHRILIFSGARPSRTWRLADRITRETPGAEICGIIQRSLQHLSIEQQLIATGRTDFSERQYQWPLGLTYCLRSIMEMMMHAALWLIHGSPSAIQPEELTLNTLVRECRESAIPFLVADDLNSSNVLKFVTDQRPEVGLVLGENTPSKQLLKIPRDGWIRARHRVAQCKPGKEKIGSTITIEAIGKQTAAPSTIAQIRLPRQTYDGLVGQTLKSDLVSDDLIIQSLTHVLNATIVQAAKALTKWTQEIVVPYLEQLKDASIASDERVGLPARHRATWKLCLDTFLLCSPLFVGRNWYRRLRRRYPITILTHHLVSDRPHRMGISTEVFWRQIRFLQRHYRIVSLGEAVKLLKSGLVDAPTAVLTFDDGYADNFVSLRAVAQETGIPITLFVATEPVEFQQEFLHDIKNGIRGALPLTWPQIRLWSCGRVEFGSHTRTHFDCGSNDRARLEAEIVGSRHDLEHHLGKPVEFFAFPFGQRENMSPEALRLAQECYSYFVSGYGGENHFASNKDNQHLLRKNLYSNAWEQELDLQSVFDVVDKLRRALSLPGLRSSKVPARLRSILPVNIADGNGPEAQWDVRN
jgi:peptidoglycan/xylan/chitin deacetylase (PgdA/CDA1 family)